VVAAIVSGFLCSRSVGCQLLRLSESNGYQVEVISENIWMRGSQSRGKWSRQKVITVTPRRNHIVSLVKLHGAPRDTQLQYLLGLCVRSRALSSQPWYAAIVTGQERKECLCIGRDCCQEAHCTVRLVPRIITDNSGIG